MSDAWAVVLAVATFAGAQAAIDGHVGGVPVVVAVGVVVAALAWRRPALLCLGAALLAAALAQRSLAGLVPPPSGAVQAEVTLAGDPVPDGPGGVRVDVRLGGRRLRAVARAAPAAALDDRLMGERVQVVGTVGPPGAVERWLLHRHLSGRLAVDAVVGWRPGDAVTRAANGLRRTLARGGEALPERQRSLLAGLTLGDDRDQPADMTAAFEAAGLTHLLAVSGQNVVFVLVVAAPVLARLRFGPRLVTTLAVLGGFALLTRLEPSVLRATAMAAVAATGAALGRPASTARTLALGVTGVLLVDPLLASSLGFRLSVAGAAGIVAGAARVEAMLPGPRWCAAALSVTLAAQLAVAPLLVEAFGAVPVASLPANLLAVPAAGPVMVWGLTGGLVAGLAPGAVARVLHLPTRLLLAWIEGVALTAGRGRVGEVRVAHLVWLVAGVAVLSAGRALAHRRSDTDPPGAPAAVGEPGADGVPGRRLDVAGAFLRRVGGLTVVATLAVAAVPAGRTGDLGPVELGLGATAWRGGGATVLAVDGRADGERVLRGVRAHGLDRVDVVVLRSQARAVGELADLLGRVWPGLVVLAPADGERAAPTGPAGAVRPPAGTVLDVGGLRLTVDRNAGGRLEVTVGRRGPGPPEALPGPARSPPQRRRPFRARRTTLRGMAR